MNYILVGIGGIFGSTVRYALGRFINQRSKGSFPIGTLIINITGAILLGIVFNYRGNNSLYLVLGEGFLGAYTTFSTFMYEGVNLFEGKKSMNGFIYIVSSTVLGIVGFWLGLSLHVKG